MGRTLDPDVVEGRQLEGLEGTIYLTLLMEGTLDPEVVEGRQLEGDWKRR